MAEDLVHAERGEPTWRRLVLHKADRIREFERVALPRILAHAPRTFLEVGCGLGYASALVKAALPSCVVLATDVSPRYLRQHTHWVGLMLNGWAEGYAACDVQALPVRGASVDVVWSAMLVYRLSEPDRAAAEIRRVLRPGGVWLGLERASAAWGPWAQRDRQEMAERNRLTGCQERPWTLGAWRAFGHQVGAEVRLLDGHRLRGAARRLLAGVRPMHILLQMRRAALVLALVTLAGCAPNYRVGQCFGATGVGAEAWKPRAVFRVEEVGARAYRVTTWLSTTGRWSVESTALEFLRVDHPSYFRAVSCPESPS